MSLVTPLTSLGYSGIKLWKGFGTGSDGGGGAAGKVTYVQINK